MSNEYKDWCWDAAQEYLLNEVYMIEEIEHVAKYNEGYLIICKHADCSRGLYFVWLDEIDGWSYKEIYI